MYYELYVDVLFLVNFTMDYLLLLLIWKITRGSATYLSIFIGAIAGALMTCVLIILPLPNTFSEIIVFHLLSDTAFSTLFFILF